MYLFLCVASIPVALVDKADPPVVADNKTVPAVNKTVPAAKPSRDARAYYLLGSSRVYDSYIPDVYLSRSYVYDNTVADTVYVY